MDQPSPGQYQILQKLGAGGMGTVYLAMDQHLKRKVAVKVLNTDISQESSAYKRFIREIEVSAQLDHPHIIKIYQVQISGEFPQLIMEFIQGKTLMDYLEEKHVTLQGKLELIKKIALAVEYAHKKKIIHRDIKPSNIMVRDNGEPVLMDFGIAKVTKVEDKSLTRSGEIVGTLQYMSPEQATGARRDMDHRTDIYSLGAVMYHILTGQMPITALSFMEMLQKIAHEEPLPLRELNPKIPSEVEAICLKALAKDKEKRYATAQAFSADISNYLKGRKTTAAAFVQQQKWMKIAKKVGLPAGICIALALAVFLVFYVVVPKMMQANKEQELVQNISDSYLEAQELLKLSKIESKQEAYQKLLHTWNINKQQIQTQLHIPLVQNILSLLRETGYELGVYWWSQDQDQSIYYFSSLQDILSESNVPENIEKNIAIQAHLAYLREDNVAFQKYFTALLDKLKKQEILAARYSEVALLQAKMDYKKHNYREVLIWLQCIPSKKYQQETLYYEGMCQYHLKNFQRAEEILWEAHYAKDTKAPSLAFENDLILSIADSIAQQFAYQKIPVDRYQPVLPILEALGRKTSDLSPEQLQHYLEMQARYHIEVLANRTERSAELGQQVLDLANRRLQNDPLYAPSYLQRGFGYRYLGQFSQAWDDYDYAFQLDPQQIDTIGQLWTIFPYYMDITDNYIEKFNSMTCRWGTKGQVTVFDIFKEDFANLRQQYNDAAKKFVHTPFHQGNFDKFYRNLSQPWQDMRNLAKSALVMMSPPQATLKALEQIAQKKSVSEADLLAIKELQTLIQQSQSQEEHIHWCYFISRLPYYGFIPQKTLEYIQTQESLLQFLRQGILEQSNAPSQELQKNWLLLQFLTARVLAQLPSYSNEYGRKFLYDLMNDARQPLERRIIVAKALHDAGLTYVDYSFLKTYIQQSKSAEHSKFLDIQVASLLISANKDNTRLLEELMKTTPHPVVPLFVYYLLPEEETQFLKKELEPLCQQALQSNDSNARMIAVLNFSVIERYREKNGPSQKAIIDIPTILLQMIRQSQDTNVQKAALFNLMKKRSYINQTCLKELEQLLYNPNPEIKLLSIAVLSSLVNPHVMQMIFNEDSNFQDQIAFFYGLSAGKDTEQYSVQMQSGIFQTIQFLKSSRSQVGRGIVYCMVCHFLPSIRLFISSQEYMIGENQVQLFALNYLKEKQPLLLFWTLAGITGLDKIASPNIKLVQQIQQDKTMPLHVRKMATCVLLYTEIQNNSVEQPVFNQILTQIRQTPTDPNELWQAALLCHKQTIRNKHIDFLPNFYIIGDANQYQIWDYYLLRFQRNIVDTTICNRFQRSLENTITLLELFPQRSQKLEEEWIQAIYLLATLHFRNNRLEEAITVLEKSNRYLRDIRLSELWTQLRPADLPNIIQHWQNVQNLSAYQQAWIARFQAQIAMQKQDYATSNDLLLQQYILAPSDPLSLILIAEDKLHQKDFAKASAMVEHILYLSPHKSRAHWTQARICAIQKDMHGAYQAFRKTLIYYCIAYPIRAQDLDDPLFDGMDRGNLCYYLANRAAHRYANAETMLWIEKALQAKAPIPSHFQPGGFYASTFDYCKNNAAFNKIWKQLEKIPQK